MLSLQRLKKNTLGWLSRSKDKINGSFELFGGFFIFLNIMKVWEDKSVAGVDWRAVAFFTIWSIWNLVYYPALGQKLSFWGGVAIVVMNTIWLSLLIYYGVISC